MGSEVGAGAGLVMIVLVGLLALAALLLPIFVVGIYQHLGRIRKLQSAQLEVLESMDRSLTRLSQEVAETELPEFRAPPN